MTPPSTIPEGISKEIKRINLPLKLSVHPYLLDHRFDGKAILPAVEILQHLAASLISHAPAAQVHCMANASFDRFLHIDPSMPCIEATNELVFYESGLISSKLVTVRKMKNGITRSIEHASVCFPSTAPQITAPLAEINAMPEGNCFKIPAHRLYTELVPFGPAFQTVQGEVLLSENGASASVYASEYSGASGPLGSLFPFDGALHAACAWSQRFCGIVAFPVGFDERVIVKPVASGETVVCRIIPLTLHEGVIMLDIRLHDLKGEERERAKGVVMKDISGGRMTPPAWIRSESSRWVV